MKVRIGNDIRLQVQVTCGEEPVNLLFVKAVFVNKTLQDKFKKEYKKKNRFMHRFPIEPFTDEFKSTAYNINSAGYPRYKAFVPNPYNGFGVYPKWDQIGPFKGMNITEYTSTVEHTADADTIVATFPAEAQKFEGSYDLIVVAQIEDTGYSNHARTVTVDYSNVFELVKSSQESDVENPVQINIDNVSDGQGRQDYYVISGSYNNNNILLNRNDNNVVSVDITPVSGWYEGD